MTPPHQIDREAVALLPCPFCGASGEPVIAGAAARYWVICEECGSRSDDFLTAEIAAGAWNRRPAPMEAVAWRWRWPDTNKWHYADYNLHPEAEEVQALAVIPTQGGGT